MEVLGPIANMLYVICENHSDNHYEYLSAAEVVQCRKHNPFVHYPPDMYTISSETDRKNRMKQVNIGYMQKKLK